MGPSPRRDDPEFSRIPGLGRSHLLLLLALLLALLALLPHQVTGTTLSSTSQNALWVDAENGDDGNDGLTPTTAFQTIQRAADVAGPGTTVHILPGVYREEGQSHGEAVRPAQSGTAAAPIVYRAEVPGTAVLRGSTESADLAWTQLTANTIGLPPGVDPTQIYYADLSAWGLAEAPRFVVQLDEGGGIQARLPLAREPDWGVTTEWKTHEFWWAADGGWAPAGCTPSPSAPECDLAWRSAISLTDRTDDSAPPGVEPGNLTTVGNLTGATLVAIDAKHGHYIFRRTIVAHDVAAGRVAVDRPCEHDPGTGDWGLGWGTKYYVEGKPYLLDSAGEWWYDGTTGRLYLWPPTPGDPATMDIEISRLDEGFRLNNRSYITLDGLTIELFNDEAIRQANYWAEKSYHNTVRSCTLQYANIGVYVEQSTQAGAPLENITTGFVLEDSEVAFMDTYGLFLTDWWGDDADPAEFTHSGVTDTAIRGNDFHHLGFRTEDDSAVGIMLQFADHLRFEDNHVHNVAHNGVQFLWSVVQSPDDTITPDEIKTGDILVRGNLFEKNCQLTTDCAGLKIWGDPARGHVYRDFLVTANVFRDTYGWTWVSEQRGAWSGGPGSQVRGMGGFGLYVDVASGVHAYRNIAYNNAFAGYYFSGPWRDGPIVYYNNIAANSLYGFHLDHSSPDRHTDTQIVDNIIVNSEGYGIVNFDDDGLYDNMTVDHNLYSGNGWRSYEDGGMWAAGDVAIYLGSGADEYYQTLAEVQAGTPWEDHGQEGDPAFWSYQAGDHDPWDGSWPDLHLTPASTRAIDRGTAALPASLTTLLDHFAVTDLHWGSAYDIGRYEAGHTLRPSPALWAVPPGTTVEYALLAYPADVPYSITLSTASPSPSLTVRLDVTTLLPPAPATLTVTDTHPGPVLQPGVWYTIPITATGGGFTQTISVRLLVGGSCAYLPLIMHAAP